MSGTIVEDLLEPSHVLHRLVLVGYESSLTRCGLSAVQREIVLTVMSETLTLDIDCNLHQAVPSQQPNASLRDHAQLLL